jgi:hypothetical protein
LLYSQVDLGAVPQTATAACSGIYTCQTVNGTLTSGSVRPLSLSLCVRAFGVDASRMWS